MTGTDERRRTQIRRAMDSLPLQPREVYRLGAIEGLDHRAVAERLGIGLDEVEMRLAEAILLIGRHLAQYGDG